MKSVDWKRQTSPEVKTAMVEQEIWIIGTDPPCPRCGRLTEMVKDIVSSAGLQADVRHLAYDCREARDFAAGLGLEPGTAKDVAQRIEVDVDWEKVFSMTALPLAQASGCCGEQAFAPWSPELDEALKPCQEKAAGAGILMTPVLIVDGVLKHSGSVPSVEQIRSWIME